MQKLILNYTRLRLHEHTHLIHVHAHYSYVHTHIYIGDMHTKKVNGCVVTSERSVFRIANSYVMFTSRGFRQYPYFVAQEHLVAFRQANAAELLNEAFSAKITI